jgi:hypothetical protein
VDDGHLANRTPRLNEWQGYRSSELEVKDFRSGDEVVLE